jgi:hypothetical protein
MRNKSSDGFFLLVIMLVVGLAIMTNAFGKSDER